MVASVLSGNRNFEGRINSEVRANYLMSPPLVVAFALAGRIDIDLRKDPVGKGKDGKPVYLADIWPSRQEVEEAMASAITSDMFRKSYGAVYSGDERWRGLPVPKGETYAWEKSSTYIRQRLTSMTWRSSHLPSRISKARGCWRCLVTVLLPTTFRRQVQSRRIVLRGNI